MIIDFNDAAGMINTYRVAYDKMRWRGKCIFWATAERMDWTSLAFTDSEKRSLAKSRTEWCDEMARMEKLIEEKKLKEAEEKREREEKKISKKDDKKELAEFRKWKKEKEAKNEVYKAIQNADSITRLTGIISNSNDYKYTDFPMRTQYWEKMKKFGWKEECSNTECAYCVLYKKWLKEKSEFEKEIEAFALQKKIKTHNQILEAYQVDKKSKKLEDMTKEEKKRFWDSFLYKGLKEVLCSGIAECELCKSYREWERDEIFYNITGKEKIEKTVATGEKHMSIDWQLGILKYDNDINYRKMSIEEQDKFWASKAKDFVECKNPECLTCKAYREWKARSVVKKPEVVSAIPVSPKFTQPTKDIPKTEKKNMFKIAFDGVCQNYYDLSEVKKDEYWGYMLNLGFGLVDKCTCDMCEAYKNWRNCKNAMKASLTKESPKEIIVFLNGVRTDLAPMSEKEKTEFWTNKMKEGWTYRENCSCCNCVEFKKWNNTDYSKTKKDDLDGSVGKALNYQPNQKITTTPANSSLGFSIKEIVYTDPDTLTVKKAIESAGTKIGSVWFRKREDNSLRKMCYRLGVTNPTCAKLNKKENNMTARQRAAQALIDKKPIIVKNPEPRYKVDERNDQMTVLDANKVVRDESGKIIGRGAYRTIPLENVVRIKSNGIVYKIERTPF